MNYKIVWGWVLSLTPIWLMLFGWATAVGSWQAFVGVVALLLSCGAMIYGVELVSEGRSDEAAKILLEIRERRKEIRRET